MTNQISIFRVGCWLLGLCLSLPVSARFRLPQLVSNGMVLQREAEVRIWGWAEPGEVIEIDFLDQRHAVNTEPGGRWTLTLADLPVDGPYRMEIRSGEQVEIIDDILVGDVWVCSGQSNMELTMQRVAPVYPQMMAEANQVFIRQFDVPNGYDFQGPQEELPGGQWQAVTPQSIGSFSAVAYFFALDLYHRYEVPIGLINASLGGSPAEAWMSEEALQAFPHHLAEAMRYRDSSMVAAIQRADRLRSQRWHEVLSARDRGYADPSWHVPTPTSDEWYTMAIPGYWPEEKGLPRNGSFWFTRQVEVPATYAGQPAYLELGRIVDADSTFLNGQFVGHTTYQYPPRRYQVPAGVLQAGPNTLTIRVVSQGGRGGFVPDKPYQLSLGDTVIALEGEWQYRLGARMPTAERHTFIRWQPMGLFNAMLAPLLPYAMRGVIWYQGESNTRRAEEYRSLFPALIRDWRGHWGQGDFPFFFVQLANYLEARAQPQESQWAELREAQAEALALPHTGMAVAIDLGEWNDIHPLDKRSVGERLARLARQHVYGETDLVAQGPTLQGMTRQRDTLRLVFDQALTLSQGDVPQEIAIAGADGTFRWAKARLEGKTLLAWHPAIRRPVALRYAWADNPAKANLINQAGLPAAPFRSRLGEYTDSN